MDERNNQLNTEPQPAREPSPVSIPGEPELVFTSAEELRKIATWEPVPDPPQAADPSPAPQPEPPREVVLRYASPGPREIVERYVAPAASEPSGPDLLPVFSQPTRASEHGASRRGRRRGMWIFLSCFAVLLVAVIVLGVLYWRSQSEAAQRRGYGDSRDYYYDYFDNRPENIGAETLLERYPNTRGVRLRCSETHGRVLSIQEVYARVNPCTVTVATALPGGGAIIGTGVIFTPDGYILTNAHVITGGQQCFVVLDTGASYSDVKLVGYDAEKDLAVIKVDAYMLPTAEFGDSDALSVGDTVYAIGNPLGVELRGTLTDGIVSAINRDVSIDGVNMTLIQTNAALNNGNSGGPLINVYGQVVGINTMKMGSSSAVSVEGLGFAIPVSSAAWMVDDLIEYGEIRGEPVLGLSVLTTPVTLQTGETALEIAYLVPDGPAERAGLLVGDRIVRADGEPVESVRGLLRTRRRYRAGEVLELVIEREGSRFTFGITLGEAVKQED